MQASAVAGVHSQGSHVRGTVWKLALLLAAALGIRLLYFTGLAVGDDVFYCTQSLAWAETGSWPPEPCHWHTRLGIIAPTVLFVKLFGPSPASFILWPLVASTGSVLVCFVVATDLVGRHVAWLAAVFQAVFPLEVIYSTHLFPDVIVGLFSVLSISFWIRALRDNRAADYCWSGLFFAAGYLCRETVLMEGPIYLVLWAWAGRLRRPRLAWVFVVPVTVLLLECTLFAATAGTAFYRWNAISAQQADTGNLELIQSATTGGDFWTDPLVMIVARQEFALYHALALIVALYALWRLPALRPAAIWLLAGYLWLYYGTTVPTGWVNLQRDPRYAACLTTPSVLLLAYVLNQLPSKLRWSGVAVLVGSGLFAASLDQGQTIRWPLRQFVNSDYAAYATLEPLDYVGARWEAGLSATVPFACADDLGRSSVFRLLEKTSGTRLQSATASRYVVFSPERRPDLSGKLKSEGWIKVAEIPGKPAKSRAFIARVLTWVPSQQTRAQRIMHPPGLVIMSMPEDPSNATQPCVADNRQGI